MKKITIFLVLTVLLLSSFSTALAGGPSGKGPGGNSGQGQGDEWGQGQGAEQGSINRHQRVLFTLVGTITKVEGGVVTVKVLAGNRLVRTTIGQDLAIVTTEETRYLEKMEISCVAITLADLEAGDSVSVQGTYTDDVWTALRFTVGALTLRK
jgi:hypothetical protein